MLLLGALGTVGAGIEDAATSGAGSLLASSPNSAVLRRQLEGGRGDAQHDTDAPCVCGVRVLGFEDLRCGEVWCTDRISQYLAWLAERRQACNANNSKARSWVARHSTIENITWTCEPGANSREQPLRMCGQGLASLTQNHQGGGPTSSLGRVSMGTEQCVVVVLLLKLKLWSSMGRHLVQSGHERGVGWPNAIV